MFVDQKLGYLSNLKKFSRSLCVQSHDTFLTNEHEVYFLSVSLFLEMKDFIDRSCKDASLDAMNIAQEEF